MALQDDIQNVGNVLKDVGGVVEQGLSIFSNLQNTISPTANVSLPQDQKTPEPIAAAKTVSGQSTISGSSPMMLVAILVAGYLLFSK